MRTWLAPSLPLALFELLADRIARRTGEAVELTSDPSVSGPLYADDPFGRGEVDLGFVCAPSWAWLGRGARPTVVAVPALPVPVDPRAEGRPVYFSDVVVPADGVDRFEDLRGRRWAYNDPCSLSGWFALKARVGEPAAWFREVVQSGSHLASLAAVAAGEVDGAAIDSTVLGWVLAADPGLARRIRVVASWGPHPIQPVVARADLDRARVEAVGAALRSIEPEAIRPWGLARFVDEPPGPLPIEFELSPP